MFEIHTSSNLRFELQLVRIKLYVNGFDLVELRINHVRINRAF